MRWGDRRSSSNVEDREGAGGGGRLPLGDDTIQQRTQGYTVPDAFTHGRADQRMRWFRTGLQSGDPRACNSFAAKDL